MSDTPTLRFGVWLDGTKALGRAILAGLIFLIWDEQTQGELRWTDAIRFYPFCISIEKESIESITDIIGRVRRDVSNLKPLWYNPLQLYPQYGV